MWINTLAMSRWGPSIGLTLVRLIPKRFAYGVGTLLARWVAFNSNATINRVIRSNQAMVRGLPYDDPRLDRAVFEVMRMNARGFVDFFKAIAGGEEAVSRICVIDEPLRTNLKKWLEGDRGVVIIAPHLLGFDVFMLYLGILRYPIQALSYPNPKGSYVAQNILRRRFGLNVTPISVQTLREAIHQLRYGNVIATAVDRPGLGGEPLEFFGQEVILPVGPARLAVKTRSRVIACISYLDDSGIYHGMSTAEFEPLDTGDEKADAHDLAQRVLKTFEEYIVKRPDQWLMFYPVWPGTLPTSQS
jgi:lauroyl/myristoyl acyltransferase